MSKTIVETKKVAPTAEEMFFNEKMLETMTPEEKTRNRLLYTFYVRCTEDDREKLAATTEKEQFRKPLNAVRTNPARKSKTLVTTYYEEKEGEEDRYIFCDNCNQEVLDYCQTCGMLVMIKDVPVPMGITDRAKKTVPHIFEIKESTIHGLGVFAARQLPCGLQLGPYEGTVTRIPSTGGYSWKLRNGKLVDAADETISNWMRYVNCAPHMKYQNVVAFQYKGELYYRTVRIIKKGEELLVYYGNSFAKELGIEPKKYFDPAVEIQLKNSHCCRHCHVGLSSKKYLDEHERRCRFKYKLVHTGEIFSCQFCNVGMSTDDMRNNHEKYCSQRPMKKKMKPSSDDDSKRYSCEQCGYKSNIKGSMNRHMKIHDDHAEKFQCYQCNFTTIYKGQYYITKFLCQRSFIWGHGGSAPAKSSTAEALEGRVARGNMTRVAELKSLR
ncbi:histone-lysine N-methyltransferase PRDM9-like [Sitophilus oryzae]|uniref:Histone-lysine N-methyltransferase PRDM9-like n=1 Tax=Sitophilus oryzae TaxID=7048 RepID=A0A6J2YVG7_SITOR|nr:histone-lysine N-methyltransferase PRDM9-like [Sitophilus oryzae]